MCGICGIYNYRNDEPIQENLLREMTDIIFHRGPDDEGFYIGDNIGLGHRRLSIIDVAGGHQPISNETNHIWIVYNGEIYNFKELKKDLEKKGHIFRTNTDTEVIVHCYEEHGEECLSKFNGMFAFALWDEKKKKLFLARDRLGIKPLYYYDRNGRFVFGSEIKSILCDKNIERKVDLTSLDHFLTFRHIPSPRTLFSDIKKLPPGNALTVKPTGVKVWRYWNVIPQIDDNKPEEYYIERIHNLLFDSVKKRLMSDVPLGLFLSGGVDSSAILAIMSQFCSRAVKTFVVGFEGAKKGVNELDDARIAAKLFGSEHYEIVINSRQYIDFFPKSIYHLEEPIATPSSLPLYFVSKLAQVHVKVALSGQGSDELFAGYNRYIGEKYANSYQLIPKSIRKSIVNPLVEKLPGNEKLKRAVRSLGTEDITKRFLEIYALFSADMKHYLVRKEIAEEIGDSDIEEVISPIQNKISTFNTLAQMLYIDTRNSLPDDLLLYGDKMSMAASIEMRVPFLDHRFVEFAETIPPKLKIKGLSRKYIYKKAMSTLLPKEILHKKKVGFIIPVNNWFKNEMRPYMIDMLLGGNSACNIFFNRDYIGWMIKQHNNGLEDFQRQLFALLSFEEWYRQFIH